jgi:ketosteroid isomerase-like protein
MKIQHLLYLFIGLSFSPVLSQSNEFPKIDLDEARIMVDKFDKKFSKHFFEGDSIALYNMYAKDATFGTLKGNDILKSWGRQIRNSIKNDTRNFIFKPILLTTDNEFLFEVGKFEFIDSNGNLKGEGKYLMVLKQEDGEWKIYHDMGL